MRMRFSFKLGLAGVCWALAGLSARGLVIAPTANPDTLVSTILGPGITSIANATYSGASTASGTFTGGTASGIGLDRGIILTTGNASFAPGPNNDHLISEANLTPGHPDLTSLAGWDTSDAAILEFDFHTATGGTLLFRYVFASDEYSEYANDNFNDVFAFFLNGNNIALLPGTSTPVSINTVNGGNPYGVNPQNPQYFVYNDFTGSVPAPYNLQYDGFTKVFTATALVGPGTHHMKLAIADSADYLVDSAVFVEEGSFRIQAPDGGATLPLMALALAGLALGRRGRRHPAA